MPRLRSLGVLLLAATLLFGLPLRVAAAAETTRQDAGVGPAATRPVSATCPAHHAEGDAGLLCKIACATSVAVIERRGSVATASTWSAVRHAPETLAARIGAAPAPDPFPPRPLPVA